MIGTDYLMIVLLWCNRPGAGKWNEVDKCRRDKLKCVSQLKNFSTDDVVNRCLLEGGK